MPNDKFLIDIERDVLRAFRTLVHRALKLTPRSQKPQVELIPVPGGVILQAGKSGTVVRRILLDASIEEPVSFSFDLLDQCQGRRGEVELRLGGDQVHAAWQDGDIPRVSAFEAGTNDFHEVTLTGSINEGRDVRFATNRKFLQRAAKLGLEELRVFGSSQPVLGRGGDCSYVWMPLAADRATQPESTMIRISSGVGKRQLAQQQARQRPAHASPSPDMAAAG